VLEKTLTREVFEEVGIKITDIEYLTSLATVHHDGHPSLVISCIAKYKSGKVELQKEETDDFAWVNIKEAKKYKLLDGIYDELVLASKSKKMRKLGWRRS
jgi:NADH pyrophosphatase NudC (nudix superfamily)